MLASMYAYAALCVPAYGGVLLESNASLVVNRGRYREGVVAVLESSRGEQAAPNAQSRTPAK